MDGLEMIHSRFEVIAEDAEAWSWDRRFTIFYYDGRRFWRHDRRDDSLTLVPSWRSPRSGWLHRAGCVCRLCAHAPEVVDRAA